MRQILKGGWIYCTEAGWNGVGDIWLLDGCIEAIHMGTGSVSPAESQVIDCSGKWLAPGLVDIRTFCGELGMQHRETFSSLSSAALAGGYTDLVLGPWGAPCVDNPAVVTDLLARSAKYPVRYHALGSLTLNLEGDLISEMGLMKRAGIVGLSDGNAPVSSSVVLRRAFQYAERLNLPVFVTPSDPDLDTEGVMHEGKVSTRIGLPGIPLASEEMSLARIVALQRDTGVRCCTLPLGSAASLSTLDTDSISVAVAARSLYLSDASIEEDLYNPSLHVYPPLRSDPQALAAAVRKGSVEIVISDHIPLTRVEQDCEFSMAEQGAMGLETALSIAYTVLEDLPLIWEKMCFAPARLLGLSKGLHVGSELDIVIFDPNVEWTPSLPFQSKGINEPLMGQSLKGRVYTTFI
jgi:dihydroorotase